TNAYANMHTYTHTHTNTHTHTRNHTRPNTHTQRITHLHTYTHTNTHTHTHTSACGCALSYGPLWCPSVSIRAPELQPGSIEQGRTQSPLPRAVPAWPGQQRASIPCLKVQKQQAQE